MTTGYRKDGRSVTLTMTEDDYEMLLFVMGIATGAMVKDKMLNVHNMVGLMDRLNTGNPQFMPYGAGGNPGFSEDDHATIIKWLLDQLVNAEDY